MCGNGDDSGLKAARRCWRCSNVYYNLILHAARHLLPRMGGFLLCPIFSVRFLQVAILCHNPVTTAALFEFDILMYSLHGSMKL